MNFEVGVEIDKYRIVRPLGRGGMGTVYEVEHIKLGVHYALKTFTLEDGNVELFRKRFLAEGKVLARLNHPNIARVFDLNYDEGTGVAYFVMDLVHYKDGESKTLADLETGGADEDQLLQWFTQMASALDYIHGEGIIHRDIKLNNILLNDKGGVMLSDFGISRFVGDRIREEVEVTRTIVSMGTHQAAGNVIMGTNGYMGPEIRRGEDATAASDTYALGVTFFRLLTGIWYEPGTDALKLLEPFDSAWMKILPSMLEADPKKRPTNLTVLADKLKPSVTTGSRRLWPLIGIGMVAAIAIAAGIWFMIHIPTEDDESFYDHLYDIPSCFL